MDKREQKLHELIDNSDLNTYSKNALKGFISVCVEDDKTRNDEIQFIRKIASLNDRFIFDIILSTDEVKIYKLNDSKDGWNKIYPYRFIYKKENEDHWRSTNTVYPNLETTFLGVLEEKYLYFNSGFTGFAMKMLGMKELT